jgi:uncharacterized Rossmann fold enzyme
MRINFVCVNVGTRYPMAYVEILRDMVFRNASTLEDDCAFWCLTDRPDELPEGVYPIPAPEGLPGYWAKLALFSPAMPWDEWDRVVYFDLDVAITGRLEDLVTRKGIAKDPGWPCHNSSVMVWDHGEHREAWDRFTPDIITRSPGPIVPANVLPEGVPNGGDQEWLTEVGGWDEFPAPWVVSYRWQAKAWPTADAKVVQFHGDPKPADIAEGWVPNVWKVGGFTSLPVMRGSNVTPEFVLANVQANLPRDLPWFTGFRDLDDKDVCVIVCGGPSMKSRVDEIRQRQRRGAKVITVNNTLSFLMARGIKPHAHVMLDARPENVEFLKDAPKGVRYLLATQCHPSLFETLADHEVVVWHNFIGEELRKLLEPYWETHPIVMVPGGGTVGLRALNLAWLSGYKRVHIYGMDGSYAADGSHHAYPQALNDGERTLDVQCGPKRYRCAYWQVRQCEEFREAYVHLTGEGVRVWVHGEGLIPDVWRSLRDESAAAA